MIWPRWGKEWCIASCNILAVNNKPFEDFFKEINQLWSTYTQYLNCKILHGGTLLQPRPNAFGMRKYFKKYYEIPSPKLNEHQKKGLRRKLRCVFLPKLGEDRRVGRNSQWGGYVGGLGAKLPAAGGTGVWGRSPQRSKILLFLQK